MLDLNFSSKNIINALRKTQNLGDQDEIKTVSDGNILDSFFILFDQENTANENREELSKKEWNAEYIKDCWEDFLKNCPPLYRQTAQDLTALVVYQPQTIEKGDFLQAIQAVLLISMPDRLLLARGYSVPVRSNRAAERLGDIQYTENPQNQNSVTLKAAVPSEACVKQFEQEIIQNAVMKNEKFTAHV